MQPNFLFLQTGAFSGWGYVIKNDRLLFIRDGGIVEEEIGDFEFYNPESIGEVVAGNEFYKISELRDFLNMEERMLNQSIDFDYQNAIDERGAILVFDDDNVDNQEGGFPTKGFHFKHNPIIYSNIPYNFMDKKTYLSMIGN